MNILMLTNSYTPYVGGISRTVEQFASEFRRLGYRVVVVAPIFEGMLKYERDVVRIPAVQHFNGSDFSVPLPIPGQLYELLGNITFDIVHSHHPFLLGDTALRIAARRKIPLVFTHHTLYDQYTHYVPGDSPKMKQFVTELVTGYCNLCETVIAPSESVAETLRLRGVKTRITVIPTGVPLDAFKCGDGETTRRRLSIPPDAFVIGYVGRLTIEKNLVFLAHSVTKYLLSCPRAHFLVVGAGPLRKEIHEIFASFGVADRLHLAGVVRPPGLSSVYAAMDVFAFSSHSETQGMVLIEAMAAGVPVVALNASGVREVVRDKTNGRLLPSEDVKEFVAALAWVAGLGFEERTRLQEEARKTAGEFSMSRTARLTLALYYSLLGRNLSDRAPESDGLDSARRRIATEWAILRNVAHAAGSALLHHKRDAAVS